MNKKLSKDLRQERWLSECKDLELIKSQCSFCKNHFDKTKCTAFPNSIPKEILFNMFIHTTSYPGDNEILFELSEEFKDKDIKIQKIA